MLKHSFLLAVLTLTIGACSQDAGTQVNTETNNAVDLNEPQSQLGYAYGVAIASNLKQRNLEFDIDAFMVGMRETLSDTASMSIEDAQAAIEAAANQQSQDLAEQNLSDGASWLEANKNKEGVTELESGLQYKVLTAGDGPMPTTADTVTVHYRGTVADGTEFDSSYNRGQPATFPVTGVIAGWTEALQLMPAGSKWELYIPADLAYGPSRRSEVIGPNQMLIFEVELLSIQ